MSDSLQSILRKIFIDGNFKSEIPDVQETNLRHSAVSNTVFEHTCKWLVEEELENQCVDWVLQYLLTKEFTEKLAVKFTCEVKKQAFSDLQFINNLKVDHEGVKRIPTDQFENYILEIMKNVGKAWYNNFQQQITNATDGGDDNGAYEKMKREISVHAIKNTRRKMEDKHVILPHFSELFGLKSRYGFYAVLDGHGGIEAAKYSSTHLFGHLGRYLRELEGTTTPSKQQEVSKDTKSPIKRSKPFSGGLLVPLLTNRQMRKSVESLIQPRIEKSSELKVQRNSYHESHSNSKDFKIKKSSTPSKQQVTSHGDNGKISEEKKLQVQKALEKSFLETDRLFCERSKIDYNASGSTCVCVLIEEGKQFFVSWAGDSQAVLVRNGKAVEIMKPHKPEREDERARITALGGSVVHFGTWRVNGAISVSRSIGDSNYKPYITSQPDMGSFPIQSEDEYIVLACDGLWDVLSFDDVIGLIRDHVTNEKKERKTAAQTLVRVARDRGSSDNITAMIVFLKDENPSVSVSQSDNETTSNPSAGNPHSDKPENKSEKSLGKPSGDSQQGRDSDNMRHSSSEISKLSLVTTVQLSGEDITSNTASENDDYLHKSANLIINAINDTFQTTSNEVEMIELENLIDNISNIPVANAYPNKTFALRKSMAEGLERSQRASSGETGISDSTNDDSKKNYLESSSELGQDLEFSPLRSDVKGQQDNVSILSTRSRPKRSPKISSSMEDKEDKENIGLGFSPCLKIATDGSENSCSDKKMKLDDVLDDSKLWEHRSSVDSKTKLKETNTGVREQSANNNSSTKEFPTKPNLRLTSPDTKEIRQKFQTLLLNKQVPRQPSNYHNSQLQMQLNSNSQQKKNPFASSSTVSVGLLKDSYRKFSQTSGHLKKLDMASISNKTTNSSNCSINDNCLRGWSGKKERWTIAVETGEDLEDMFESPEQEIALNVSSTRW